MDLLDIIIFSLKIFALTSLIIVAVSYFIFKLKDRTRVKPYMNSNPIETSGTILKIEDKKIEPLKQRYEILNDESISIDKKHIRMERPVVIKKILSNTVEDRKLSNIFSHYSKNAIEPMHKIKH